MVSLKTDLHRHTQGLVRTPASTQQPGQTGCTSQSQHHPSEQSISEEKQRNREKRDGEIRQRRRHGRKRRKGKKTVSREAISSHLLSEVWVSSTSLLHSPPPPSLHLVVAVFSTPAEGPLSPPCLNPILDLSRHFVLLNE